MAIIKKYDGKDKIIAEKSLIDHSQLSGRESYGAHPISAIRKLPEKLFDLKEADSKLDEKFTKRIDKLDAFALLLQQKNIDIEYNLNRIEQSAKGIDLELKSNGIMTFTDFTGAKKHIRFNAEVDNDTIRLDDARRVALKKVYVDNKTIKGLGVAGEHLELKNKPDELTIITDVNNEQMFAESLKTLDGGVFFNKHRHDEITNHLAKHDQDVIDIHDRIDEEAAHRDAVDKVHSEQIGDLLTRTAGMGGYLNAYDFGKSDLTKIELTAYARVDIGLEDTEPDTAIYNGTKVKNLYDNNIWILTNTPEFTDSDGIHHNAVFSWENQGSDAVVSDANNDGVHGLVTGSYEHLEGFIDGTGRISINGLQEELDNRVHKIEYSKDQTFADGSDAGAIGRLYMRFRDNTENSIVAHCQAYKFTVPVRDSQCNFYIGEPSQKWHAATKNYVDSVDALKVDKYLDKQTWLAGAQVAYGAHYDSEGNPSEATIYISSTPISGRVARWSDSKTLKTETPIADNDSTNKKYVDDGLNTKVDKITSGGLLRVYGITGNGTQTVFNVITSSNNADVDRIPRYQNSATTSIMPNDNAVLATGTPVENHHAANKLYVDTTVTNALIHADNTTIIENTDQTFTAVGLYDPINAVFKSAENLFRASTIVILGEGD